MIPRKNKKAAIELSIGTVVIIVIAMTMLIMGIVLVRNIFSGAITNVDQINANVKEQINQMFQSDQQKGVVNLPGGTAKIKPGESYGIAFGVRNKIEGPNPDKQFHYETKVEGTDAPDNCGVSDDIANSWIQFGSGDFTVQSGEIGYPPWPIKVILPEGSPLCTLRYTISVQSKPTNTDYTTLGFIVEIK